MIERIYILETVDPVIFYGVNNSNMQLIKPLFGGRRENALLDCFQNVSNGGLGFRKL